MGNTRFHILTMLTIISSFAACTTPNPDPELFRVEVESSGHWILVSEGPLTFLPKGLPKNVETEYRDGEWIHSAGRDARWFVPRGGVGKRTSEELMEEALSMRTAGEKRSWDSKKKSQDFEDEHRDRSGSIKKYWMDEWENHTENSSFQMP